MTKRNQNDRDRDRPRAGGGGRARTGGDRRRGRAPAEPPPTPAATDRANLPPRPDTHKVYGLAAALAVMTCRPEQVVRIAHTEAARKPLASMLREAARRRIAYREVPDDELSRIAESVHHEGVCLLVSQPAAPSLRELAQRTAPHGLVLALDRVGNPHNVGAILRTAAFFGACGLVLGGASGRRSGLPPAAVRVAEGGAEYVPVVRVPELADALSELAGHGLAIVGADAHAALPLAELRWPARVALVIGSEDLGLSPGVRAACASTVRIVGPGQDTVDSLNVSVATGVLLASYRGTSHASKRS
jgi:TrmH RNA methyltransferase